MLNRLDGNHTCTRSSSWYGLRMDGVVLSCFHPLLSLIFPKMVTCCYAVTLLRGIKALDLVLTTNVSTASAARTRFTRIAGYWIPLVYLAVTLLCNVPRVWFITSATSVNDVDGATEAFIISRKHPRRRSWGLTFTNSPAIRPAYLTVFLS